MTQRRFNSLPEAKRYIYECLHATLSNDLVSGDYIFNEGFSDRDQERVEKAAQQVLNELYRRAQPRRD